MLLLAVGSVFVGYLGKELTSGNVISPIISNFAKIIPLLLSLVGAFFAFVIYNRSLFQWTALGKTDPAFQNHTFYWRSLEPRIHGPFYSKGVRGAENRSKTINQAKERGKKGFQRENDLGNDWNYRRGQIG